ncbi:MAG: pantoate--beta-alanine ligase [Mariprofundaceae bacterium]|nr:pantoate--beta-alanine ligase [Mariprofundaceae bacterium]
MSRRIKTVATAGQLRHLLAMSCGKDRIVLVPTMGCLHDGHMALIRRAKDFADIVVVSIYVNPLQFGPDDDFDSYPRSFADDCAACESAGADIVFHPQTLYPAGQAQVRLAVGGLADCLCGEKRAGHFDGVVMAVAVLFNIVQPDVAVFGEKDWQQLAIIRRMAVDLQFPVKIIDVATQREADGLAMSSRNRYLSENERKQAVILPQTLKAMQKAAETQLDVQTLVDLGRSMLAGAGLTAQYLEIRDADDLTPLQDIAGCAARAFIACQIGPARLIDNIPISNIPVSSKTNKMTETP